MKQSIIFVLLFCCVACGQISMSGGSSPSGGITMGSAPGQLVAFGDSVTAGAGADNPVFFNDYVGQLMTHYGWQQRNYAVGGCSIGDWSQFQHQIVARTVINQVSVAMFGINDVFQANFQSIPLDLVNWGKVAMGNILYAAIKFADQLKANSASWTRVGTWTAGSTGLAVYDGYGIEQTSTVNDTATISLTGTSLYLVWMANITGDVTFDVSVDGVSQGSFSNLGPAISSELENYHYYPLAARFAGFSSGAHSLRVTYSSGTTPLILMWASSNVLNNYPKFFALNCIPESGNLLASNIAALNSTLQGITTNLLADGLKVYYVDANSVVNPNTDMCSLVHPCQSGYNNIATKTESVIDANP